MRMRVGATEDGGGMRRDYHDLLGGGALMLFGLAVAGHAAGALDFGTLRQMGPGFFPVVLGLLLAALGLLIAVPAWRRHGEVARIDIPEAGAVLGAILVFALLMNSAGLIIATALSVLIASLPAPRRGVVWRLVLAAVVTLATWAIFSAGLGMTIPLWPWSR